MTSAALTVISLLGMAAAAPMTWGHPIPDVPVRADFDAGSKVTLQVEVDPRCFEDDPNTALSVLNKDLKHWNAELKAAVQAKAQPFVESTLAFFFPPVGERTPEFRWEYTAHEARPLSDPDDIVVLTGTWTGTLQKGEQGYQLEALTAGQLNVVVLNRLLGRNSEVVQVLFPNEKSRLLDITPCLTAESPVATKALPSAP